MNIDNNRFGKNLKLLRKGYGETMANLAAFLRVDTSAISRWESGERQPEHETLKRIAEHYRVTTDDLLRGESINPKAITFWDNKDAYKKIAKALYPLACSDEAKQDGDFYNGYRNELLLFSQLENENPTAYETIEKCINFYSKSYDKQETVESRCNLLGLMLLTWNAVINEDIYKEIERTPGNISSIVKKVSLGYIPLLSQDAKEHRTELLELFDKEADDLLKEIKASSKWNELADYYLALRYMFGMIDNGFDDIMNNKIGMELLSSFALMGNQYALNFLSIRLGLSESTKS